MATTAISRSFLRSANYTRNSSTLSFHLYHKRLFVTSRSSFLPPSTPALTPTTSFSSFTQISSTLKRLSPFTRLFCSESTNTRKSLTNTTAKFEFSDSDSESEQEEQKRKKERVIDKSKLPPPYDPFSKKPAIEEPKDPKDLQEVFHKMRTEGLINNAVKMFDGLSKDGLTHEAMELFSQMNDKGNMPEVIAHTAVVEAYANAGQCKEALKVFMRMLACGVKPNAYTYTVLIKGLAGDGKYLGEAKRYVMEMMEKGMRPNAGTYTAVFEGFAREQRVEEGTEFLEQMKSKGFVPDEKAVREAIQNKRGQVYRTVYQMLFGK